jgi:hypothetical protein
MSKTTRSSDKNQLPIFDLRLSDFSTPHQDLSRPDSDRMVYESVTMCFPYESLRNSLAKVALPWATFLRNEFVAGLTKEPEKSDVLVVYQHGRGLNEHNAPAPLVFVYFLGQRLREFGACSRLLRYVDGFEQGRSYMSSIARPLALWRAGEKTAYRLYPVHWEYLFPGKQDPLAMAKQKEAGEQVLHIDHGALGDNHLSSYILRETTTMWAANPTQYTNYEVVPTEADGSILSGRTEVRYRNAMVLLRSDYPEPSSVR